MQLLKRLELWLERWSWSEMDHYFARIHPDSIKDIDKFLQHRGWM
jgi:hypothetical protein